MILLFDEHQPMPTPQQQSAATLIGIRRGALIQVVKSAIVVCSGMKTSEEFRKIVDETLQKLLDESPTTA